MTLQALRYLHFEASEDADGIGTLEAMASTWPEQAQAVQAEVAQVLAWAFSFAGRRGPVQEGGDWDYDLHGVREVLVPETLRYDPATGQVSAQPGPPGKARHTLTLTLSGTPDFCDAFRQVFSDAA